MPLKRGKSKKVISENISEFHQGKTYERTKEKFGEKRANAQAVAVAMSEARKSSKKKSKKVAPSPPHHSPIHPTQQAFYDGANQHLGSGRGNILEKEKRGINCPASFVK